MSRISTIKFACCAAIFAFLLLIVFSEHNNSVAIAISKNKQTQVFISAEVTTEQTSIVPTATDSIGNSYTSGKVASKSNSEVSGASVSIGVIDITQTQIIPQATASSSSTYTVPKTPTIRLTYSNDAISLIIDADSIKSFELYRSINGGTYIKLSLVSGNSYKDINISDGNTYGYKALCTKNDGTTVYTSESSITLEKLLTLSGVTAQCRLNDIVLSWQRISGANYYTIYRNDSGTLKKIATVSSEAYTDSSLTANSTYSYVIDARDSGGNKIAISCENSYKTLYLPSAPTLKLYSNDEYGIEIAWTVDKDALSYNVYKYIGDKYILVKNTKNNFYIDSLASGTCTYVVSAVGSAGEGTLSNEISAIAK